MTALEEYRALYKAWHPIPPHPHPGSIAILLVVTDAAIAEVTERVEEVEKKLIEVIEAQQQEHKRAERAEQTLDAALDVLVVYAFDVADYRGRLTIGQDVHAIAKDRLRAMLEADDE